MDLANVVSRLRVASRTVALTGAGVSAESGIPTFRDAQTGIWAMYDPEELATPKAFVRNPKLVWDWYEWRRALCQGKQPNPGHLALAEMARILRQVVVVTQNIDGLHDRAASPHVIELHGNINETKCSREGIVIDRARARPTDNGLLTCPRCGAFLRPNVVWFGEPLPRDALDRAFGEATQCDVFLAIGTSGVVEPAASLVRVAHQAGAWIIEINPEETPLSQLAHVVLRAKSGEILPEMVDGLRRRNEEKDA